MADRSKRLVFLAAIVGVAILAALPLGLSAYGVSTGIVYFANIALATAWAFFSGPTRYISLATAAFVGVGMYTVAIAHVSLNLARLSRPCRDHRFPLCARRRAFDASPSRRLLRHLHLWPHRTHAPSVELVRNQHHQQTKSLHYDQHRFDSHLRNAARPGRGGGRRQLVCQHDPARSRAPRDRRGRDGRPAYRHRRHLDQGAGVCDRGFDDVLGRRRLCAALPKHRSHGRVRQRRGHSRC